MNEPQAPALTDEAAESVSGGVWIPSSTQPEKRPCKGCGAEIPGSSVLDYCQHCLDRLAREHAAPLV